ncbi:hypothetical protein LN650_21470 [Klebsiella pneumoniae subsp. pneumoniae]|nr:hypothetical protein [Klebsiella pneumoniae subsp. pneumoniae]
MALRDEEVTGELPADLEFEEVERNSRAAAGGADRSAAGGL